MRFNVECGKFVSRAMSKNCDHSKAFKTEALCMNSLRKREHFVAYTVKLGAVLKCSGLIHTWVC